MVSAVVALIKKISFYTITWEQSQSFVFPIGYLDLKKYIFPSYFNVLYVCYRSFEKDEEEN